MQSLRSLFRVGRGPSSSHTMGPSRAASAFSAALPVGAHRVTVTLYGSLAATGRGHLTDLAVREAFEDLPCEIDWRPQTELPAHPNGMRLEAFDETGACIAAQTVYSVGGGALMYEGARSDGGAEIHPWASMDEVLAAARAEGLAPSALMMRNEGEGGAEFLDGILDAMEAAIGRGLAASGTLPGEIGLERKAACYLQRAATLGEGQRASARLFAYALAVSEENAAAGTVVTAPTCGASGVLPAVLQHLRQERGASRAELRAALATAGLVGLLIRRNASISGAEVGCQGEVGAACAMAAAAACQVLGGDLARIEYAAEMGLEHHLGLTCDPVGGHVQIPCIERNAMAAVRALDCANYALLSDGGHHVSFDEVVAAMWETGRDLQSAYRETSRGGLARVFPLKRAAGPG